MKKTVSALFAALALAALAGEDEGVDWAEYDWPRWYCGAGAALAVPQGGMKLERSAGAEARLGYYADDFLAVEASAAWLERGAAFGLNGLWHWWGYEKFDPFFTFGAKGWTEGALGPSAGWGCFWHFDDCFSLRFDLGAMLDLEGEKGMVYGFALAVQYDF